MSKRKDAPARMWALKRKSNGKWFTGEGYTLNRNKARPYETRNEAAWFGFDADEKPVPVLVTVREERPHGKAR